jgi:hypothetical protein
MAPFDRSLIFFGGRVTRPERCLEVLEPGATGCCSGSTWCWCTTPLQGLGNVAWMGLFFGVVLRILISVVVTTTQRFCMGLPFESFSGFWFLSRSRRHRDFAWCFHLESFSGFWLLSRSPRHRDFAWGFPLESFSGFWFLSRSPRHRDFAWLPFGVVLRILISVAVTTTHWFWMELPFGFVLLEELFGFRDSEPERFWVGLPFGFVLLEELLGFRDSEPAIYLLTTRLTLGWPLLRNEGDWFRGFQLEYPELWWWSIFCICHVLMIMLMASNAVQVSDVAWCVCWHLPCYAACGIWISSSALESCLCAQNYPSSWEHCGL